MSPELCDFCKDRLAVVPLASNRAPWAHHPDCPYRLTWDQYVALNASNQ